MSEESVRPCSKHLIGCAGQAHSKACDQWHATNARLAGLQAIDEQHRGLNGQLRADHRDLRESLVVMRGIARRVANGGTMGLEALEAEIREADAVLARTKR